MNIGINIATWCFDKHDNTRYQEYDILERLFPSKRVRFLQAGYTIDNILYPWYEASHEKAVVKELQERGWHILWTLINDNVVSTPLINSGQERRAVIKKILNGTDVTSNQNRLLMQCVQQIDRLLSFCNKDKLAFEVVNADIEIDECGLVHYIKKYVENQGVTCYTQGAFIYDYRKNPQSDVRITGINGAKFVSEFGVESSLDIKELYERTIYVLGMCKAIVPSDIYFHELVSRAWGYLTWRDEKQTLELWDKNSYISFLNKRNKSSTESHSKYVAIIRDNILNALASFNR